MTEILTGLALVAAAYYLHKVVGQKYEKHVEQGSIGGTQQHVQPQANVVATPMHEPITLPARAVVNVVMPSRR